MSVPILAIKEANEHLQALFLENQKKDGQIHELSVTLKEAQEEIATLNEHLKAVNERVAKLQEEHSEALQTLHTENEVKIMELKKSHEKNITDLEERLKLEENLKLGEEKKVAELTEAIGEERVKVAELEGRIQKVNEHIAERTKCREENVALLNNIFKSTIENMSECLSITGKEDFVGFNPLAVEEVDAERLDSDSAYSSKAHLVDDGILVNDTSVNDLTYSNEMQQEEKLLMIDSSDAPTISVKLQQSEDDIGLNEDHSAELEENQHESDSLDGNETSLPTEISSPIESLCHNEHEAINFQGKVNGVIDLDSSIT